MKNKLKIVYISIEDSNDLKSWSGSVHAIKKSLIETYRAEVFVIDKLKIKKTPFLFFQKIKSKLTNKYFDVNRDKTVLKYFVKEIKNRLPKEYDFILASSSLPITYLDVDKPIYFYTDATFHSMLDYYFMSNSWSKKSIQDGNYHEKRAIKNAAGIFYASHWAKNDAVSFYNADPKKIEVVLFGANNVLKKDLNAVKSMITKRLEEPLIRFLFVGVDWERKGGNTVIETLKLLEKEGINVQLDLVGIPKIPIDNIPNFVVNHGFLNQNKTKDKEILENLYLAAHFLFVPSRQECLGVVFVEASALGIPAITTNTGGIPSIVKNNSTGYTLDPDATPETYKNILLELLKNKDKYKEIALNAYQHYTEKSNWYVIGNKIIDIFEKK